jgi:hypothetical protein
MHCCAFLGGILERGVLDHVIPSAPLGGRA